MRAAAIELNNLRSATVVEGAVGEVDIVCPIEELITAPASLPGQSSAVSGDNAIFMRLSLTIDAPGLVSI
jgi:hypothetical protein